jgi:hypothetical protein
MQLHIQVHGEKITAAMQAAIAAGAIAGLEKAGLRGQMLVQQREPVGATGLLKTDTFAELHQDGPEMHEVIGVSPPADVYSAPVEDGTRPHMPPSSGLLLWVKKKLLVTDERQAQSIAFAIAKTIAKRGTKGVHMFEQAFTQLQTELVGIFEVEIAAALERAGFGVKD